MFLYHFMNQPSQNSAKLNISPSLSDNWNQRNWISFRNESNSFRNDIILCRYNFACIKPFVLYFVHLLDTCTLALHHCSKRNVYLQITGRPLMYGCYFVRYISLNNYIVLNICTFGTVSITVPCSTISIPCF